MRAVRKGERRPTSSVFKSIESLSRFNDRFFDPFPSALVFFFFPPPNETRIRNTYLTLLSRITRVIARFLLASRIGRIHRMNCKLFVERKSERSFLPSFREKFEKRLIKKIYSANIVIEKERKVVSSREFSWI